MSVALQVTNGGKSLQSARPRVPNKSPTLKAELWSSKYGVPLAEPNMSLRAKLKASAQRFGRRVMKTFGPDKALEGLKEPIPADVMLARPIMTRRI